MKVELYLLEKITIDGKDIFTGKSIQQVINLLGEPDEIIENHDCGADFENVSAGVFYENDEVYFDTIGIGVEGYNRE